MKRKHKRLIKKHGFEDARKVTYVKLPATQKIMLFNSEHEVPMAIISEKEYNAEARKQKKRLEKFIMHQVVQRWL